MKMNELYKAYAMRARTFATTNSDDEIAGHITDLKYSKFLELVVNKCIAVIENSDENATKYEIAEEVKLCFDMSSIPEKKPKECGLMDIYSKPGEKVVFAGNNGHYFQRKAAKEFFSPNQILTVSSINIENWSSTVEFKEYPGKTFNTVMFVKYQS